MDFPFSGRLKCFINDETELAAQGKNGGGRQEMQRCAWVITLTVESMIIDWNEGDDCRLFGLSWTLCEEENTLDAQYIFGGKDKKSQKATRHATTNSLTPLGSLIGRLEEGEFWGKKSVDERRSSV